ncbi:MAG: hypothetical protein E7606_04175 [Ruminococcaceae bacterium]|nr:hypothetical protein [Oscillospiraceae bacterium]
MNDIRENARPRLPLGASLLLTFCLVFFMSFSVSTEVVLCRYMVVLVFAILLLVAVRSKLVTWLLALPCLLAFLGAGVSADLPLIICAIAVMAFGGFAIRAMHPMLVALAPALAYLLAFALTGDAIRSLSVLTFVPLAIVVAIALRLKLSRTASIALFSVSIVVYAAIALLLVLPEGFTISAEGITNFISQFREFFVKEFTALAATEEYAAMLGSIATRDTATLVNFVFRLLSAIVIVVLEMLGHFMGLIAGSITTEEAAALVNLVFRLLPAIVIVVVNTIAYLVGLIAVSLHSTQFPEHPLPKSCLAFRMSGVSALLFLVSFLATYLLVGKSDIVGILSLSALNLFVILTPGLALCGVLRVFMLIRQKRFLSPILLIVLLIWFASSLLTVLSFIGAFTILRAERLEKRTKKG